MAMGNYGYFMPPFSHRLSENLNFSEDVYSKCGYIEIISNTCALADGCKSILEYNDEKIKLSFGKTTASFHGSNLSIKSLSMEQAMIEGIILSVEFGN